MPEEYITIYCIFGEIPETNAPQCNPEFANLAISVSDPRHNWTEHA